MFLAADYAPARFDDREVGDGTALERAGYVGGKLEYDSDPRRAIYATIANQTQVMGAGIYATSVQASAVFHALPQLDIELLPQLTWAAGEYRYAWQSVGPYDPYLFGKLAAKNVSATLRASYTFTPRLTLQAYAQAFLASGHFSDLRAVGTPAERARRAAAPAGQHRSPVRRSRTLPPSSPAPTPTSKRRPSTPASSSAGSTASVQRSISCIPAHKSQRYRTSSARRCWPRASSATARRPT